MSEAVNKYTSCVNTITASSARNNGKWQNPYTHSASLVQKQNRPSSFHDSQFRFFYYNRMWFPFIPLKDAILDFGFDKRMTASFVIIMKIDKNSCVLIALASLRLTAYQLSDFQGTKETATRQPGSTDTPRECGTIGDPEIGAALFLRTQEIRSKKLEI